MSKTILNKLLWKPAARWNLLWAGIGAFVGLTLVLMSLQLYLDVQAIQQKQTNVVLLQKKVSTVGSLLGALGADPSAFAPGEITAFGEQPFCRSVSPVRSNHFRVTGELPQSNLYMYLFLQSVPDNYLDISPPEFVWQPGQREVPMILSKEFLSLYNFAAAPAIGTPIIPANLASSLPFRIILSGNGLQQEYPCRIVGFSQRLNTLLVPETFLEHANRTYGDRPKPTKQLVAFVENPAGRDFQDYLSAQNWEIGRAVLDRVGGFAAVLMPVLGGIGTFVALLALLVYGLNFRLLVAQSAADIKLLLQMGYRQKAIVGVLNRQFVTQFAFVLALTGLMLFVLRWLLGGALIEQGFALGRNPSAFTLFVGICLGIGYFAAMRWNIWRAVRGA